MLRVQIIVSLVFAAAGVAFPIFIAIRHGVGSLDIYDRTGAVVGQANYLLFGVGAGIFMLAISCICVLLARRSLTVLEVKKANDKGEVSRGKPSAAMHSSTSWKNGRKPLLERTLNAE